MEFPGKGVTHLYFVEEGMASMTTTFEDGSQVEVGMFGFQSVIGASGLMGSRQSLNRVYTQIAGSGYRVKLAFAQREFERGELFHDLVLRCVQAQLLQAVQSTGCNARHDVVQRLARWLLLCADRVGSNSFHLSQDFLADMLGSTRPTIAGVAGKFKAEGLIDYTRGAMQILNRSGLERKACECYFTVREHMEDMTAFDSGVAS